MRPARTWRVAAAVLIMALMAVVDAPNVVPAEAGEGTREAPRLKWRSCSGGECAKLSVPLDYAQPEGQQIKVALFRIRALDRSRRIGSLLLNPGGPGASGVEFVRQAALALPLRLRQRFDLVGFDPRGTGGTIPVNCRANLDRHFALDLSPDDTDERAVLARRMNRLAQDCERHNREILPHISSLDTVQDMDRIRAALGDDKLTFVGFSYGTYLGALYADLFPARVRALVLDGAVDPQLDKLETNLQQAAGFEASLATFLEWCSERRRCAFHNDGDAAAAYDRLSAEIDARPLAVGDRRLGPGEFDLGVVSALYSGEFAYETLADALAAAAAGDGEPLLSEADSYSGRRDDGTYDHSQEAFWAVGCVDGPNFDGAAGYAAAEPAVQAVAPRVGISTLNYDLVCGYWKVPPNSRTGPLDAAGAPPILVIGTTGDPATPVQWSEALAGELASGVLLVVDGTTHTSFLSLNSCVDDVVVRYLIRLVPPAPSTTCDAGR